MLNIDVEFMRGVLFIRPIGIITKETKFDFKSEIYKLINRSGITNIVINFENIKLIDQQGIDIIYEIKNMVERNEGNLVICNASRKVEEQINNIKNMYLFKSKNELTALNTFNI